MATLVKTIARINQAGLAVVVDLHPSQDEKQALIDSGDESFFVEGWRRLARALAHLQHELVMFELMNEPTPMVGPAWRALQKRTIEAIRTVAPQNTLIANPGGWSGIEDYAEFRPYPDANVIYTAHVYEPLLFTHQGTTWAWEIASQVKDVWWPLPPEFGDAASNAQRCHRRSGKPTAISDFRRPVSGSLVEQSPRSPRAMAAAEWQPADLHRRVRRVPEDCTGSGQPALASRSATGVRGSRLGLGRVGLCGRLRHTGPWTRKLCTLQCCRRSDC